MSLVSFNLIILIISLAFLLMQLLVRNKSISHILFAIFCGSIAMTMAKNISGESIGVYKYLIGLGTIATCNCYWLLSRSLFRADDAIRNHHLVLAIAISVLILINQSFSFANYINLITVSADSAPRYFVSELTALFSSCILVLSFWEGCRGFKNANEKEKYQRTFFLVTYALAVILSKVPSQDPLVKEWIISSIILFVLINTQILINWLVREEPLNDSNCVKRKIEALAPKENNPSLSELQLAKDVETLLTQQKLFLRANLKVADIARELNLPEYRVSRAIRAHIGAKNFNQYVNELRITYAQEIMVEPDKQQWSTLVVALESGFASVGPFTRSFKAQTGLTPKQYKLERLKSC